MAENEDEVPLNSQTQNMAYFKSIFDMCDKNGDSLVEIKDVKEYIKSPRGRFLALNENILEKINIMVDENPERTLEFTEFLDLVNTKIDKNKNRRNARYWTNKYVNIIVPRKHKKVPKGRRVRRAANLDESQSYQDEYSCCPPPVTMLIISLIEILFYIVDESVEKNSTYSGTGVTANFLIYDPMKRSEAWRYVTYMFVHVGHFHIISNVLFQILVGLPLEMVHHYWRILTIYLAGVIAGSLASSIVDPWVKLAGASGGVYAILTAHIASIIMNWSEMDFPSITLFIIMIFVGSDLGTAIYERYYLNINETVSSIGHVGGATAGLLVGIYILRNLKETTKEKYIWWAALVLYIMLMCTGIALNIFLPLGYFQRN